MKNWFLDNHAKRETFSYNLICLVLEKTALQIDLRHSN